MTLSVERTAADAVPADVAAVGLPAVNGADGAELMAGLPAAVGGVALPVHLDADWCRRQGFTAKPGQALTLAPAGGGPVPVVVGLGPVDGLDRERWRRAAAALVRAAGEGGTAALVLPADQGPSSSGASSSGASSSGASSSVVAPSGAPSSGTASTSAASSTDGDDRPGGPGGRDLGAAVAEGAVLAAYRFEQFRSKPRPGTVDGLLVVADGRSDADEVAAGLAQGARTSAAVSWARDQVNTPAGDLPPRRLAERTEEMLESRKGVTVEVWEAERIDAEHLGGLGGVSRGSAEPPRLVRADYDPADPIEIDGHVPHVVLVGKGITFDSGGLSLKTADGMTTMKTDMTGAAVVLATLGACPDLDVRVKVTALAPLTENMPGGRATRPGDVLTIRNGLTIEVLNTDAEGRLILADALSLAAEMAPDAIVDVATLTGGAVVALGAGIAAVFGNDDALVERIRAAGGRAGEKYWPMPLPEEYAEHIDSEVADMKNMGKPGQASAIAAALLLARFVGDVPWAHLDIAGTARAADASGYLVKGGTAFGVRTLLELLGGYGER
jgi:leucyl aminopeptidase